MPNSRERPKGQPVETSRIACLKQPAGAREVALFVTVAIEGRLKPHVPHYVASLARHGIAVMVIVVSDEPLAPLESGFLDDVTGLYVRENKGFDFAAWAHVLRINPQSMDADILYLINDSVFGPTSDALFGDMLAQIRSSSQDMIGLTENVQRGWHLQSYFLAFRKPALQSPAVRDFLRQIGAYETKDDVINEYETQLAPQLRAEGLQCSALFPTLEMENPTLFKWRQLLAAGFPFLKVATVRDRHKGVERSDWRQVLEGQGYDTRLADLTLADLAAQSVPTMVRTPADAKLNFRRRSLSELHRFFASGRIINLPQSPDPVVSILVVVYNEAELTLQCLTALESTVDISAEIIIVDNASSDDTTQLLNRVRGVRVVRNVENLHFLRGVNQAAARARGRTLLLLNSDACLRPGALRFALEALDSSTDIGAVGGKLILPDGTLQEAGSIIWADGACAGYGRGRDPEEPEFQFRREVDYCSGAFLLLRRDLFERLDRLDTAYVPAYYEETDLCMRIRKSGYRVLYDPRIEVLHYEFASSGAPGEAFALMQRNLTLFRERHRSALERLHLPPESPPLLARTTDRWRPRLLMIDDLLPNPSYGAGFPRTNRVLSTLNRLGFFVTYYPVTQNVMDNKELFDNFPVDVEFILGTDRPQMADFIDLRAGFYQGIIVCRPVNMQRIAERFESNPSSLRGAKIVYDSEAVTSPREAHRHELTGVPLSAEGKKAALDKELQPALLADAVVATNEHEAELFRCKRHENVHVVGNAVKTEPTPADFAARRDFLLVGRMGDDKAPNVDSLFWFIREVMPHIDELLGPSYKLYVAGEAGAKRLAGFSNERVVILGRVGDLTPLYNQARVFIAPTRYAAGIPLKVLEAASRGVPCVVTDLLVRQLGWIAGEDVLAASTPEAFAQECARLYSEPHLWSGIRRNALERIAAECNPKRFEAKLVAALQSVHLYPPLRTVPTA
jgi:GT2 family glycosyltransferase